MLPLHPQFIEKDGRRESVVLPYEEFEAVIRELQAYDALRDPAAAEAREVEERSQGEEEAEPYLRL